MSGSRTFSVYFCIFDDWTMLRMAVSRIADRVDEIVVVDGAYEWMAPFFRAEGRDPARSDERVYEALAPWASKLRVVTGVWTNEIEKRAAGYAACSHRYIWRLDADEVLFINDAALESFLSSGKPIANMEIPLIVAPGLIRAKEGSTHIERGPVLFDSKQVGARDHLAYLWLVLPPEERDKLQKMSGDNIFHVPIAFNAHLTGWRPVATAVGRARFYVLNYLRYGHPTVYAPGFKYTEATGFGPMIESATSAAIDESLSGNDIVVGLTKMEGFTLAPVPLTAEEQAVYAPFYTEFLDGLADLNRELARTWRRVANGQTYHIDLTSEAARAPLLSEGAMQLRFANKIHAMKLQMDRLLDHAPWFEHFDVPFLRTATSVRFNPPPRGDGVLREIVRINAWPIEPVPFYRLGAGSAVSAD